MSDYINREKFIKLLVNRDLREISTKTIGECLDKAGVADVVKVVRCKDCIFYYKYKNLKQCKRNPSWDSWDAPIVTETDYCSYGERKDNE